MGEVPGPQGGETVELADGVKMTFVLVPPGKFRMGSPNEEQDYVTKTYLDGKRSPFLDYEALHEVTLTEPVRPGKDRGDAGAVQGTRDGESQARKSGTTCRWRG